MQPSYFIHLIYIIGFLLAFHSALPAYVSSSFVATFTPEQIVGLIYTVGAILSLIGFMLMPRILNRFGNYKTLTLLLTIELLSFAGLAVLKHPLWLIPIFVVSLIAIRLVWYSIDVLLASYSNNTQTGRIRGLFLTFINMAWLISPAIAGLLLQNNQYPRVYAIGAVILFPVIIFVSKHFKTYTDPSYHHPPFWDTFKDVLHNKDIMSAFANRFLLQFFYAWMVIYTPIYLHHHIGFDWVTIGYIFTIMLLPFSLFEYTLGKLADTRFGEKEFMIAGFIIMALATGAMTFITGTSFWLWAGILFCTRVGAACVEIMDETYFFKKVPAENSDVLSFFRTTDPLAYIIAPLIASALLIFIEIHFLFIILGVIVLLGIPFTLRMKDTL